jgi:hypothetical protein
MGAVHRMLQAGHWALGTGRRCQAASLCVRPCAQMPPVMYPDSPCPCLPPPPPAARVDPASFRYSVRQVDRRGAVFVKASLDDQRLNYLYHMRQSQTIAGGGKVAELLQLLLCEGRGVLTLPPPPPSRPQPCWRGFCSYNLNVPAAWLYPTNCVPPLQPCWMRRGSMCSAGRSRRRWTLCCTGRWRHARGAPPTRCRPPSGASCGWRGMAWQGAVVTCLSCGGHVVAGLVCNCALVQLQQPCQGAAAGCVAASACCVSMVVLQGGVLPVLQGGVLPVLRRSPAPFWRAQLSSAPAAATPHDPHLKPHALCLTPHATCPCSETRERALIVVELQEAGEQLPGKNAEREEWMKLIRDFTEKHKKK